MQHRHLQIELQQPAWILEREAELLKRSALSLRYYAGINGGATLFKPQPPQIKLPMDGQCNTRAFYYSLLYLIYQCDEADTARSLELSLKSHVYSPLMKLDQYRLLEIDQQYRDIYDNATLKKLFVEFGQALNYQRGEGRVLRTLSLYPVMDFVLRLVVRGLYHLDHTHPWTLAEGIPTPALAQCLSRRLSLEISRPQSRIYLINNGSIRFVESPTECTISKLTGRSLLGEIALSTQDSLPLVESFEEELLNQSLMSDNNVTPQFNDMKGSHAKFERFIQNPGVRADQKQVGSQLLNSQYLTSPQQELKLCNIQVPQLRFSGRASDMFKDESPRRSTIADFFPDTLFDSPIRNDEPLKLNRIASERQQQQYEPYITAGMTSPQVLRLMRPKIAMQLNEKKKRSVMQLISKQEGGTEYGTLQSEKAYRELSDLLNEPRRVDTDRAHTSPGGNESRETNPFTSQFRMSIQPSHSPLRTPFASRHSYGYSQSRPTFSGYQHATYTLPKRC